MLSPPPVSPDVSVVVPVRNGRGTISEQLDALDAQTTCATWELVVADNGSIDGTIDAVHEHTISSRRAVTVVSAAERVGVNVARNAGVAASRAPLVLFCDADDIVGNEWIEQYLTALATSTNTIAAGPLFALATDGRCPPDWALELTSPELLGSGAPCGWGSNMAVHRSVWQQLGGFDESIVIYADDTDFFARAFAAGVQFVWVPGAGVRYRAPATLMKSLRRAARSGKGVQRWRRDNPQHGQPTRRRDLAKMIAAHTLMLTRDAVCRRPLGARAQRIAYLSGQCIA